MIVGKDKRITARATCASWSTGTQFISVPEDFLVGRVVGKRRRRRHRRIIAKANDELTEALLKKLRAAASKNCPACITNELDQGAYISQTLASTKPPTSWRARGHLPHDAPRRAADRRRRAGPVPSPVLSADTYDLSRVGRMKFNARVGRATRAPEGPMTLSNEDILDVVKILVESAQRPRRRSTTSTTSATAACAASANWPRTSTASALARIEKAVKERLSARPRPRP